MGFRVKGLRVWGLGFRGPCHYYYVILVIFYHILVILLIRLRIPVRVISIMTFPETPVPLNEGIYK